VATESQLSSMIEHTTKRLTAERKALDKQMRETADLALMSSPLITVSPDATIKQCSIIMLDANIRRAVVMKSGQLVGIVSDTDIFQSVEERGWGPG